MNTELEFWSACSKTATCWKWTKSTNKDGYGILGWRGKTQLAHRVAFFIFYGTWPMPQCNHKIICTMRTCCNPRHLYAGTPKENTQDAILLGTHHRTKNTFIEAMRLGAAISAARRKNNPFCKHGHIISTNMYLTPNGNRQCRECRKVTDARRRSKQKNG